MINVPRLPHEAAGFKMAGNGKDKRKQKGPEGPDMRKPLTVDC